MTSLSELGGLKFEAKEPATSLMETLRKSLAKVVGITVQGPYMTLRFSSGPDLVCISFQVTSITHSNLVEFDDTEDK